VDADGKPTDCVLCCRPFTELTRAFDIRILRDGCVAHWSCAKNQLYREAMRHHERVEITSTPFDEHAGTD
jgi:hypothetical protein